MKQKMTRILKLANNRDPGKKQRKAKGPEEGNESCWSRWRSIQNLREEYGHLGDEIERIIKSRMEKKKKDNEKMSLLHLQTPAPTLS